MRCQLENVLVDCLRETLNVILCSGSTETMRAVERSLKQCPLYSLFKAKTPQALEEMFGQVQSWHVAIVDEQCQFAGDFMTLVRGHQAWLPVVALTNSWSIRSLSSSRHPDSDQRRTVDVDEEEASGLQFEVVEERPVASCPINSLGHLMQHVQEWTIKRKLVCQSLSGLAREAMDALFRANPLSVDDWSSIMGVKPRRFQREFKMFTDLSPKKILALYHAYRIAFSVADEHNHREKGVISAYIVDDRSKERVMEYVLTHRSAILTAAG